MNPKKLSTSLTFIGIFYSLTALIFSCSILTCPFPTITPSIGISSTLKSHFDLLKHNLCFYAIFKDLIIHSLSPFIILASITKSSMYFTNTPSQSNFQKMLCIILQNVPSKLHSPKYITCSSNNPLFVSKATFHSLSS